MDNTLHLDNLPINFDLMERSNPVFNTAKMTLFQLSASGNPYAGEITSRLGLTYENTQSSNKTTIPPEIALMNITMLEIRYKTMEALAKESGFKNIVDLPCGYTPRAIECAKNGIPYIGIDLPRAIEEASPIITSMIDKDQRHLVRFVGADATNFSSLEEALSDVKGELCIMTEGLMMYLTDSEIGEVCSNIANLLAKHGGCWITADIEASLQYILIAKPFFGDKFLEIMAKSKSLAEKKSDISMGPHSLILNVRDVESSMEKALKFLASHGLKAERIPVSKYMPKINMFDKIELEKAVAIQQAMSQCCYWKITLLKQEKSFDSTSLKSKDFDVEASLENHRLHLDLCGRIDSINAPKLLAFFEKISKEETIKSIIVNCKKLDYISSAGLRVLLIMYKSSDGGVTLQNVNEDVQEILRETGFDAFLLDS